MVLKNGDEFLCMFGLSIHQLGWYINAMNMFYSNRTNIFYHITLYAHAQLLPFSIHFIVYFRFSIFRFQDNFSSIYKNDGIKRKKSAPLQMCSMCIFSWTAIPFSIQCIVYRFEQWANIGISLSRNISLDRKIVGNIHNISWQRHTIIAAQTA